MDFICGFIGGFVKLWIVLHLLGLGIQGLMFCLAIIFFTLVTVGALIYASVEKIIWLFNRRQS